MHVAIIMDGNGRWAEALGRPRLVGHEQGARRIRAVVEARRRHSASTCSRFTHSPQTTGSGLQLKSPA